MLTVRGPLQVIWLHPAVLRLVADVIAEGHAQGKVNLSVCGERAR